MKTQICHFIFSSLILLCSLFVEASPFCADVIVPKIRQSTFVDSQGKKLSLKLTGPKQALEVVIFLNGIDRDLRQWNDVTQNIEREKPNSLLVQVDLFGQGETSRMNPKKDTAISFENQVRVLNELIENNSWQKRRLILVGHSYGGGIAARYVRDHPRQIREMVLIAPYVDNLEVYQPGIGPALYLWKAWSELTFGPDLYDTSVLFGSQMAMISTWYSYSFFNGVHANLSDVLALTRGNRNLQMTKSVQMAGDTRIHMIQSAVDEMIPATAHWNLWTSIPVANRGFHYLIPSTHNSVRDAKTIVAQKISSILN